MEMQSSYGAILFTKALYTCFTVPSLLLDNWAPTKYFSLIPATLIALRKPCNFYKPPELYKSDLDKEINICFPGMLIKTNVMPLNILQYNVLSHDVGIPNSQQNYQNGYLYCDGLFNSYIQRAISYLNLDSTEKVVLLFLESCPVNTANYIFGTPNKLISSLNDSYLWNIYTGFFGTNPHNGMSKMSCLDALLNYKTGQGSNIPVVILDLFPFHGIDLKRYRKNICDKIANPLMLKDVLYRISSIPDKIDRLFLFGVPYTIWNYSGGYGIGSIYIDRLTAQTGLLGRFGNTSAVVNIGGRNISSNAITDWRKVENIA